MAVRGTKPKPDGLKRNRMPAVHDWLEVEDVPFKGKPLVDLPSSRRFVTKLGVVVDLPLSDLTGRWWKTVRSMPHCSLWTESDWQFAVTTALVADAAFNAEPGAMAELRQREKLLGTTMDARRDLRIRYVPKGELTNQATSAAPARKGKATVTSLDSRRGRLTGAS